MGNDNIRKLIENIINQCKTVCINSKGHCISIEIFRLRDILEEQLHDKE